MSNPKISVIIPVYNAAQYLEKCLDSVLAQTFTDFELLLIDDGSKDSSGEICDRYAESDSRIRVFHKPNGGVSSARNLGLDNAKGEWITFVDADDELSEDALESLLVENADFVVCGYECYNMNGEKFFSTASYNYYLSLNVDDAITQMYMGEYYNLYSIAKLYKSSIIKNCNVRFDESLHYSEDRLFVVQYLCSCIGQVIYSSKSIYKYILRADGAMNSLRKGFNSNSINGLYASLRMMKSVAKRPNKYNIYLAKQDVLTSYIINVKKINNYKSELNKIKKSLKHGVIKNIHILDLFFLLLARICAKLRKAKRING